MKLEKTIFFFVWTDFRERKEERNINLLLHLYMHLLVDSHMCPDQGLNLQPQFIGDTAPTQLNYPARAKRKLISIFCLIMSIACRCCIVLLCTLVATTTLELNTKLLSYSRTSVLKLSLFQKKVWEVICSKTESYSYQCILSLVARETWDWSYRYQHKRVVGSRTKVLFDNQDIFFLWTTWWGVKLFKMGELRFDCISTSIQPISMKR